MSELRQIGRRVAAIDHKWLDQLLAKTQQQAEELQSQEEELRAANEELQAQAEALRTQRFRT